MASQMRFILLLSLSVPLLFAYETTYGPDGVGSLVLMLKDEKLQQRVTQLQHVCGNFTFQNTSYYYVSIDFVEAEQIEIPLIHFHFEEEHKSRIETVLEKAAAVLCKDFPRWLTFDKFAIEGENENTVIRGQLQRKSLVEFDAPLASILDKYGFIHRKADSNGFAATKLSRAGNSWIHFKDQIEPAVVKTTLRASAYIDKIFFMAKSANSSVFNYELGSVDIEC